MLKLAMGSVLLVTAAQAVAVSLGAMQGSAIIGRPLDLQVQSSITDADAAAGLCLESEVLYGDRRVPATAITTAIHQLGADGAGALRIQVSEPVNEPIVTLVLRAGCTAPFQRSYTLLADMEPRPPSPVRVAAPVAPSAAPGVPVVAVAAAPVNGARALAGTPAQTAPAELPAQTPIRLAQPAPRPTGVTRMWSKTRPLPTVGPGHEGDQAARQAVGVVAVPAPAAAALPRLQLDPVDISAPAALAAAQGEQGSPVVAGQEPAVSAPEPDLAANLAQQQALQQELQTLRAEQERMRLALETVNAQLLQAQSGPSQQFVVYGLSALSLLLLGGLWFAMRSRRRVQESPVDRTSLPWWESALPDAAPSPRAGQAEGPPGGSAVSTAAHTQAGASAIASVTRSSKPSAWSDDPVQGMEVAEGRESMFREVPVSPLNLERLQDVWQRAEFCVSIGQHRDAMDALRELVIDGPRCSEGPYLWWLRLAHAFGTEADRAEASRYYETHFQRMAPNLKAIESPFGLGDDAPLLQSLLRDWPAASVKERLLAALASQPGDTQAALKVRTLAAFDDLVTLVSLLDTLDTLEAAQGRAAPVAGAVLDEHEARFPSLPGSADGPEKPRFMLDFELPPAASLPAQAQRQTPASAAPRSLDFDFDLFDLQPKEGKPESDGAADEPGTKT